MARAVTVFMITNKHREDQPQLSISEVEHLTYPSNSTQELLHVALEITERAFKTGFGFKKAGVILAPLVPSSGLALAAMAVVVFGHAIWVANLMVLPTDLFPSRAVASAAGFSGMGGAIGGALASAFIGTIVTHFSYVPIFICAGLMHPLSALLVWKFLPEQYFRKEQ